STCCRVIHSHYRFFFNHLPTFFFYTLSLHDALPIFVYLLLAYIKDLVLGNFFGGERKGGSFAQVVDIFFGDVETDLRSEFHLLRSEEHTSELQSRSDLVCRLLLEKKN